MLDLSVGSLPVKWLCLFQFHLSVQRQKGVRYRAQPFDGASILGQPCDFPQSVASFKEKSS
jgi:hypothetical protein